MGGDTPITEIADKRAEWARHWKLPLVAMLGVTGSAAYSYSSGVFMVAMTAEFGWSRAQFSSALTVQMLAGLLIVPFAGRVLDRLGPRRMALMGIAPFVLIFSAMGLANGDITQWWLLTGLLSLGNAAVMTTLWVAGTTRTFDASRGLAMGVALAGMGLATGLWPVLAASYIEWLGWRLAFPAMALSWAAVVLPLTVLFFRPGAACSRRARRRRPTPLPSARRCAAAPSSASWSRAACSPSASSR